MHQFYAYNKQSITYILLLIDNVWQVTSLVRASLKMIHRLIKNWAQWFLIYGCNFTLNSRLQLLCCVWGDSCICILSSIPKGRNPGLSGPVNVEAIVYLTHENARRRSYSYMLHTPLIHCNRTGFEMTWHSVLLGVQTLPPTTPPPHCRAKIPSEMCQLALHQPVCIW